MSVPVIVHPATSGRIMRKNNESLKQNEAFAFEIPYR